MVPRNSSYETTVSVCGGTGMDARIVYIRGFVSRSRRFVFCNQCEWRYVHYEWPNRALTYQRARAAGKKSRAEIYKKIVHSGAVIYWSYKRRTHPSPCKYHTPVWKFGFRGTNKIDHAAARCLVTLFQWRTPAWVKIMYPLSIIVRSLYHIIAGGGETTVRGVSSRCRICAFVFTRRTLFSNVDRC